VSKEWRIRVRFSDGYPPTYHGPFTRDEAREFLYTNFSEEQEALFDVNITRGDHGGEWTRQKAEQP
jgi:hypothetical protein